MKVPKKVLNLVRQLESSVKTEFCFKELNQILLNIDSEWKYCKISEITIVDEPCGHLQNQDEYVDQVTGYLGDDYSGVYYYSIEDSDKYLAVKYSC